MPRRGENIYKRKDGRWEGRYIKERINQQARYGYVYGKSYTEVRESLKNLSLTPSANAAQPAPEWKSIVAEWMEAKKLTVKPSTLSRYRNVLAKHIIPLIEQKKKTEKLSDAVQKYLLHLSQKGYAPKTVSDILTIIKGIYKFAQARGCQIDNIVNTITVKVPKSKIAVLTEDEERRLCRYLCESTDKCSIGVLLCLCTGIRIGELCALKWSDVDLTNGIISINHTLLRIQSENKGKGQKTKVIISTPKSEESRREIPISSYLLKQLKQVERAENSFVLTGQENRFVEPRTMQYFFKSILKKCHIPNYKFHVLRHTFATRCVEQGVEIKSLSEILGHSGIKITLDKYVHSSMQLKKREIEKLNILNV